MIKIENRQSSFEIWKDRHFEFKEAYQNHHSSFIACLLPEVATGLSVVEVLDILQKRYGSDDVLKALNPDWQTPSPVIHHTTSDWLKRSNIIGVNVRTKGNFFNVIKYLLTVPDVHNAIHLLPVWEPGVESSIYGKVSWNINPEFFSGELKNAVPHLDTAAKQLKVTVNLIHLMGKTAGMEVIPHTDRFSEITLAFPRLFEWLKRVGGRISGMTDTLYKEIEEIIWLYLHRNGTANFTPVSYSKNIFFDPDIPILTPDQKMEILFGRKEDSEGRLRRREELIQEIINHGFETLPLTMAPPYRNLHINQEEYVYDDSGNKWYSYELDEPESMSKVFGSLTRYKFFMLKDGTQDLDFERPNHAAWEYISTQYGSFQKEYNFDFMRGDMAHIQPRKEGVPASIPAYYDPLKSVRDYIKQDVPYFGFLAETFLSPPGTMAYGVEEDHLEAIGADISLGSLQSSVIGSADYLEKLEKYYHLSLTRNFSPVYTLITGDSDHPDSDRYYKSGNHLRLFTSMFLTGMPSYMSSGFETRNPHKNRGKNEEYNSLFVFRVLDPEKSSKVTRGPFSWGNNHRQFAELTELRNLADEIGHEIKNKPLTWISAPSSQRHILVWQMADYIFVVNQHPALSIGGQNFNSELIAFYDLIYSSTHFTDAYECRIYKKR